MTPFKEYFLLNHGSYGATPRSGFEAYQKWQLRLETQPVLFLGREIYGLLKKSREALGQYLNAAADDLVYIPNATHGVNIVARSLALNTYDEILTTDHEYGLGRNE
jgi:isopenicillin-N epimerase